ncbi:MAG: hypothetical protein HRF49_06850 [bacterium]
MARRKWVSRADRDLLLVDCTHIADENFTLLLDLVKLSGSAFRQGLKVRLLNPSDSLMRVLDRLGLLQFFEIARGDESAKAV